MKRPSENQRNRLFFIVPCILAFGISSPTTAEPQHKERRILLHQIEQNENIDERFILRQSGAESNDAGMMEREQHPNRHAHTQQVMSESARIPGHNYQQTWGPNSNQELQEKSFHFNGGSPASERRIDGQNKEELFYHSDLGYFTINELGSNFNHGITDTYSDYNGQEELFLQSVYPSAIINDFSYDSRDFQQHASPNTDHTRISEIYSRPKPSKPVTPPPSLIPYNRSNNQLPHQGVEFLNTHSQLLNSLPTRQTSGNRNYKRIPFNQKHLQSSQTYGGFPKTATSDEQFPSELNPEDNRSFPRDTNFNPFSSNRSVIEFHEGIWSNNRDIATDTELQSIRKIEPYDPNNHIIIRMPGNPSRKIRLRKGKKRQKPFLRGPLIRKTIESPASLDSLDSLESTNAFESKRMKTVDTPSRTHIDGTNNIDIQTESTRFTYPGMSSSKETSRRLRNTEHSNTVTKEKEYSPDVPVLKWYGEHPDQHTSIDHGTKISPQGNNKQPATWYELKAIENNHKYRNLPKLEFPYPATFLTGLAFLIDGHEHLGPHIITKAKQQQSTSLKR